MKKPSNFFYWLVVFILFDIAAFFYVWNLRKQNILNEQIKAAMLEDQKADAISPYLTINFGYSLGFTEQTKTFPGPMESAFKSGAKTIRIYDPFYKANDTNTAKIADYVKYYIDHGAQEIILTIGCNAFSSLSKDTAGRTFTAKQKEAMLFTNRCFPKDTASHIQLLKKLGNELSRKMIRYDYKAKDTIYALQYCGFELGDESDAEKYFWGTPDEWKRLAKIRFNALLEFNRPTATGSWATSLLSDSSFKHKSEYSLYISKDAFFTGKIFSHSFYWINSSSKNDSDYFDLINNDYPDRTDFSGTWITEYNLFTGFDKQGRRKAICNSPEYGHRLYLFLLWCYDHNVSRLFFHPLCVIGNDQKALMGAWDKKWDAVQRVNYYVLNNFGKTQYEIMDVCRDGYYPIANGLQGKTKKIIFTVDKKYTITNL